MDTVEQVSPKALITRGRLGEWHKDTHMVKRKGPYLEIQCRMSKD